MQRHLWETWSNLAFPLAALFTGSPLFIGMMLILGIASAYYHAGGVNGNHLDVAAIYAVLFYLIGIHWGIPPIYLPVPALAAGAALRWKTLDIPMEVKIGVLVVPLLLFGAIAGSSYTLLYGTITLVVAVVVRRWLDHGLWHILSAIGLSLVAYAL